MGGTLYFETTHDQHLLSKGTVLPEVSAALEMAAPETGGYAGGIEPRQLKWVGFAGEEVRYFERELQ